MAEQISLDGIEWSPYLRRMETRTRLSIDLPESDLKTLRAVAQASGRSMSDLIRRAVPLIELCHAAQQDGHYFGVVADRSKLDRQLPGIF